MGVRGRLRSVCLFTAGGSDHQNGGMSDAKTNPIPMIALLCAIGCVGAVFVGFSGGARIFGVGGYVFTYGIGVVAILLAIWALIARKRPYSLSWTAIVVALLPLAFVTWLISILQNVGH